MTSDENNGCCVSANANAPSTLSLAELNGIVKNADEFVPIPTDDIEKIKEQWKAAQTYDFEHEITEDELPDSIRNDPDSLAAWRKEYASTARSRKILRDKFNSMTDDDFRKWAEEANSNYKCIVGMAKHEIGKMSSAAMGENATESSKFDYDWVLSAQSELNKKRRLAFLRITNPKRKRGNPIDKEPEEYRPFLEMCKRVRSCTDFNRMDKIELKTRLIQEIASTMMYQNSVFSDRNALVDRFGKQIHKLVNCLNAILVKYPDVVNDSSITEMLEETGIFDFHNKEQTNEIKQA